SPPALVPASPIPISLPPYSAHRALHSFPTRRSSDLTSAARLHHNRKAHVIILQFCASLTFYQRDALRRWYLMGAEELLGQRLVRSEEHTSELQSRFDLVCRLLLDKKN